MGFETSYHKTYFVEILYNKAVPMGFETDIRLNRYLFCII